MRFPTLPATAYAMVVAGASLAALSGCGQTDWGNDLLAAGRDRSVRAGDQALKNIEWAYCHVPTIGSIKRNYMGTVRWPAYLTICEIPPSSVEVTP